METNEMLENIAAILAGITRSRLFWDVQQSVRGERIMPSVPRILSMSLSS